MKKNTAQKKRRADGFATMRPTTLVHQVVNAPPFGGKNFLPTGEPTPIIQIHRRGRNPKDPTVKLASTVILDPATKRGKRVPVMRHVGTWFNTRQQGVKS